MACGQFTPVTTRREMLRQSANSFGLMALAGMLNQANSASAAASVTLDPKNPLAVRQPHFPPRAKRIIFLFMHGGPSQVDTFDPKPLLKRDNGKPYPGQKPRVQFAATGNLLASPWEFRKYGQCGTEVSDLFPHVAKHVDKMCVIRSIHANNSAHGGALLQLHTGSDTFVRPSIGSWVTYGLGSENQNLPGFVTICPTLGHGGVQNWSSAFLPAAFQGTPIGDAATPAKNASLRHITNAKNSQSLQRQQLDLLRDLNQSHLQPLGPDLALEGRINSFELAFRMQTEAPTLMDISNETKETLELYGINGGPTDNFGRQCLLARRFAEKGVRFIQCTHSYKWDQHGNLRNGHGSNAKEVDQGIAGLLEDLSRRGLLDDTLVWWGGEFGRTPTAQGNDGRDHNPHAFSMWLAGGGVKGGTTFGETDDYGYYSVKDKVHMHDLHATILALMGMDHEKLTYRYAGRDFRLTDVHGRIVKEIMA
ncbi:DUF1501 domain-containing protein [Tuwongella immobilis]|uniref:Sulfatase n=1 Tax=Tuwongella immobilis TaxID=692036 RepID=A0A6C2YNB4_9BACT|nr:DUF1501 domain-containing protein [Tuwongella immobilis]VIP02874.1 secreted protein containing duf1501 : Uncharacterized protein OS=Pirellula staleyi (strain ATCC 27377 / DSM 6068 / ICPB 4128) GN=Psta_3102 PE=4 SV=1: DUF1501 [Tuwongella immobilis]VTS02710.1 secreted protein containing duf1501 : Uncharacterized protein OS=Pirellula staleyi (strain ATCC 27377 / DSM 6068 / ICPB 4128) GN=Psta_3102 PE=4 SV=1: DUF1501 [Tuwongella immobilis]